LSKSFQKLWLSSGASNLTDGLLNTAAPLLATTLTKDPFWIATIAALSMLPWLLFAIPIGGFVDRFNRRNMIAIANTIRFSSIALLSVSIGFEFVSLWVLLLATFLFGIGEVIYDTTLQSMLPQVLRKDQLEGGNARLTFTSVTLGEFIGAPLGGLLFAAAIALPFYLGTAGILIAVLLVISMPREYALEPLPQPKAEKTGFWEDIRFGIKYLYQDKTLLKLVLLTSAIGFFFAASSSTMVLFFTETLQTPPALFGVLFALPAAGALIGSAIATRLSESFGRTKVMAAVMLISSVVLVIQGFSVNYWMLTGLLTVGSVLITIWNVLLMATYHEIIPTELFGRIHGTRRTLVWGLMPIGSLIGGLLAGIDLRLPLIVGGVACSILALVGARFIVGLTKLLVR
jgi:MFS family permease